MGDTGIDFAGNGSQGAGAGKNSTSPPMIKKTDGAIDFTGNGKTGAPNGASIPRPSMEKGASVIDSPMDE